MEGLRCPNHLRIQENSAIGFHPGFIVGLSFPLGGVVRSVKILLILGFWDTALQLADVEK